MNLNIEKVYWKYYISNMHRCTWIFLQIHVLANFIDSVYKYFSEKTFIKTKMGLPCIMLQHRFCKLENQIIVLHYFYILHISPAKPILIYQLYHLRKWLTFKNPLLLTTCNCLWLQKDIGKGINKNCKLLSHK